MKPLIKICGMREPQNIKAVAELEPDLMGFIFYPGSPRFAGEMLIPDILHNMGSAIRKTGVFVNPDFDEIISVATRYHLDTVQIHGNISPVLCHRLKTAGIYVFMAFNIDSNEDFKKCIEFINCTEYFLFDNATDKYGGSGQKFNWDILEKYHLEHPFFLSGGIGPLDAERIAEIKNPSFHGVDLNSRFEIRPGVKDLDKLKKFIHELRIKQRLS